MASIGLLLLLVGAGVGHLHTQVVRAPAEALKGLGLLVFAVGGIIAGTAKK